MLIKQSFIDLVRCWDLKIKTKYFFILFISFCVVCITLAMTQTTATAENDGLTNNELQRLLKEVDVGQYEVQSRK